MEQSKPPTNDQVLSAIRQLHSEFDELSLQIRIDTPWVRVRNHIRYGLNALQEIPMSSRCLAFMAVCLLTIPYVFKLNGETRKKLTMFAIDTLALALVLLGQP